MTNTYPQVGFIGLGAMGYAMSTHLVRTGFPVTGYDIYTPTLDRWEKACSEMNGSQYKTSTSPSEAVKSAQVVCLMVANHHHVHSALFDEKVGAVYALPKGVTVIVHATIPPTQPAEVRRRLTEEFGRGDVTLIDAPVSGGTARSANGTLTIMAAYQNQADLANPTAKVVLDNLSNLGKTLYPIPGGLGNGQSAKALNQVMCGIHIVSSSEIMGLAAVNGLDTRKFFETLVSKDTHGNSNRGWSWMFENRAPRMLTSTPAMSSATSIINKDVGIIRDEETRVNTVLPLLNQASDVLTTVMKTHAAADDSCIVQYYLGFDSPRMNLAVEQAEKGRQGSSEEQNKSIQNLAWAHATIHLNSAFETVQFAKSLDLMGEVQKQNWFRIISGAAGGSTTFSEVVPLAFADPEGIESAFKKYAKEKFAGSYDNTSAIVHAAKKQGYEPVLLESSTRFLKQLLSG